MLFLFIALNLPGQIKPILIKNIEVVSCNDDNEVRVQRRDVLISGNKIKDIQKRIRSRKKYLSIDGSGKYLIPGLSDMHAHLPSSDGSSLSLEQYLQLHILAGVTYIRSMRGAIEHPQIRALIRDRKLIGPEMYLSPVPITARTSISLDSIDAMVGSYKQQGFDFIKILSIPDIENFYEELVKACRKHELPIAGHIPKGNLLLALENAQQTIEHLQGYVEANEQVVDELIQLTREKMIFNCPTLDWTFVGSSSRFYSLEDLKKRPGLNYLPEDVIAQWEKTLVQYLEKVKPAEIEKDRQDLLNRFEILKKMRAAECPVLLSPDASSVFQVPGFGLVEEMKLFKLAGYTNEEIFEIATINPAKLMGMDQEMGRVQKGFRSNLVILTANPLEDVEHFRKIDGVLVSGLWHSLSTISTNFNLE